MNYGSPSTDYGDFVMAYPVPVPGSAPARLIKAGIDHFQRSGFADANVTEIAATAGVTTGSLYHHFGSKAGLYAVIRQEMERRMTERIEGVAAAASGPAAISAAFRVTIEAAHRFGVTRILSEPATEEPDRIAEALLAIGPDTALSGPLLAALWREALRQVAYGTDPSHVLAAVNGLVSAERE